MAGRTRTDQTTRETAAIFMSKSARVWMTVSNGRLSSISVAKQFYEPRLKRATSRPLCDLAPITNLTWRFTPRRSDTPEHADSLSPFPLFHEGRSAIGASTSVEDPELYGSSPDLHAGPVSGCLYCGQASIALVPLTRFPVPNGALAVEHPAGV